MPEQFVAGLLIEKLLDLWSDYKQQFKHKKKHLSMADLITHIIIEDTNRKKQKVTKAKKMTTKATWSKPTLKGTIIRLKTLITNPKLLTLLL